MFVNKKHVHRISIHVLATSSNRCPGSGSSFVDPFVSKWNPRQYIHCNVCCLRVVRVDNGFVFPGINSKAYMENLMATIPSCIRSGRCLNPIRMVARTKQKRQIIRINLIQSIQFTNLDCWLHFPVPVAASCE